MRGKRTRFRGVLAGVGFEIIANLARGGPPFATDDPVPAEFRHWEIYVASQYGHGNDGAAGAIPQFEINYGAAPNLMLHLVVPMAFNAPSRSPRAFGLGDVELGAKYRFKDESDGWPQIGVFPLVELPAGSSTRGLGSGHTQVFLPVWLQRSMGDWTTYGGGGYWLNPGAGNRNWWFTGWLVQRQVRPDLAVGAEIYHETAQTGGGSSDTWATAGITWDLDETRHILLSIGHALDGSDAFQAYLGFQLTFGPGT